MRGGGWGKEGGGVGLVMVQVNMKLLLPHCVACSIK